MKSIYFIFLSFILLFSCSETNKQRSITQLPDPTFIKGDKYEQEIIASIPSQIEIIGNNIFLFRTMRLLAQGFDKHTGNETVRLGYIGEGPGEFMSPYFAGENKEDSTYYVSDYTYNLMRKYKWEIKQDTFSFHLLEEIKRKDQEITFYTIQRIDNGYYVALTTSQKSQHPLVLLDNNLNVISEFGEMFEDEEMLNPRLYYGTLASYGNQIIYAPIDFDYIVSYTISDKAEIKKDWEHYFSEFSLKKENGKTKINRDKNRRGFYDVKMTGQYIYSLYSGQPRNVQNLGEALPQTVLIFRQDGSILKSLFIDKESGRIAIDGDSILYVSYAVPDSGIAFYDIRE